MNIRMMIAGLVFTAVGVVTQLIHNYNVMIGNNVPEGVLGLGVGLMMGGITICIFSEAWDWK